MNLTELRAKEATHLRKMARAKPATREQMYMVLADIRDEIRRAEQEERDFKSVAGSSYPELQLAMNEYGYSHVKVIDPNTVEILADGKLCQITRTDVEEYRFTGSGLGIFGNLTGDWRIIENIYTDMKDIFENVLHEETPA